MTRTEDSPAETANSLPPDPWHRLARYRDDLDSAAGLAGQIAATLRAARTECRADAAVWYSATKTESALVDAADPDTGWAIEVARLALASAAPEASAGTWVPADPPLSLHPAPTAVAFARLRPARLGSLLVVLTRPSRAFDREAQAALRYFGRALTLHHQHQVTTSGLRSTLTGVFKSLVGLLDVRDPYMAGHGERVGRIARRIGEQMGLSTAVVSDLYLAGLLHDVGTLGVPDEILLHPGKLTGEEMGHMRRHVLIGDEQLASAKHVERLRPGVRNHHERWDGKGYPDGLRGEQLPLLARVVAVADACDALMSARRYRPPLGPPQIQAVLRRFAGSQWDPQVVDAFLVCSGDIFPPIYQKGVGESAVYALSDVIASEVERSTILHAALLTGDRVGRG